MATSPIAPSCGSFDSTSQLRLKDKLDYENFILDFLFNNFEFFEGGKNPDCYIFSSNSPSCDLSISAYADLCSSSVENVISKLCPLTFTAAFKMLDMGIEWILEENQSAGNITSDRWNFVEKKDLLRNASLILPRFLIREPQLKDCFLALFAELFKFRNNVIHGQNFSSTGGTLDITDNGGNRISLNQETLGFLIKSATGVCNILSGSINESDATINLIKYSLDQIDFIHKKPKFNVAFPDRIKVVYKSFYEEDCFPVDLDKVRQKLTASISPRQPYFNLTITGIIGGESKIEWLFPFDSIPNEPNLKLKADDHVVFQAFNNLA
jgi:hypothetical protein